MKKALFFGMALLATVSTTHATDLEPIPVQVMCENLLDTETAMRGAKTYQEMDAAGGKHLQAVSDLGFDDLAFEFERDYGSDFTAAKKDVVGLLEDLQVFFSCPKS